MARSVIDELYDMLASGEIPEGNNAIPRAQDIIAGAAQGDPATAVEEVLVQEDFDPLNYLLTTLAKDPAGGVDTSVAETAIQTQLATMVGLQEDSSKVLSNLTSSSQAVRAATTSAEESTVAVQTAELSGQLVLENQLKEILESQRAQLAGNSTRAASLSEEYITDMEVADQAADVSFLDFLQDPMAALKRKEEGRIAKERAAITAQQLNAVDAVNKFQADNFLQQADSLVLQGKLRDQENEGLYKQQITRQSILRSATLNRQLTQEDASNLGQVYGLSSTILNGLVSGLNAQIAAGNVKSGNLDRLIQAAQLKQNKITADRITKEAARGEDARAALNSSLQRAFDGLGIPYSDPNTLVEQFAGAQELNTVSPTQLSLIGQYVVGNGINASSIFNSADPIASYEQLMATNPDLVPDAVSQVMRTFRTDIKDANGQTLTIPPQITDPKEIRAYETAHLKSWWAKANTDYNAVFQTFPGNLHSPSDITDYKSIEGFPVSVVEAFQKLKINTTSGESYFQELLGALSDPAAGDAEQLALGAASLSRMHFNGLREATGISVNSMNIPALGGDATNPQLWYSQIQTLRSRKQAIAIGRNRTSNF